MHGAPKEVYTSKSVNKYLVILPLIVFYFMVCTFACIARRAGSDGSMSASGSAGPGFNPLRGSKF